MIDPVSTPISVSSLQGMQNAEAQLQKAAGKIAQWPGAMQNPQSPDVVDLSAQMVAMMGARDNFMANVEVSKAGDQLQRALLNIVG